MEVIRIVHKPVYAQRPYDGLPSPYTNHPVCSVLCQHSKAPVHHKSLVNLQRISWLEKVRTHANKASSYTEGEISDAMHISGRRSPSGMTFIPMGIEGLQVNIPEEFLAKFARSDSRPDSPAPTLLSKSSFKLDCYRRCVTPDSLDPIKYYRFEKLRRGKSEGDFSTSLPFGVQATNQTGKLDVKRKLGRSDTDFTAKLSKQLDLAAKSRTNVVNKDKIKMVEAPRKRGSTASQVDGKSINKLKSSDDTSTKSSETHKKIRKQSKRKGDKKSGLEDPEATAVSNLPDSHVSSRHSNSSSASSKPTSGHSSKLGSGRSKVVIRDPLSYDPKQFLSEGHQANDDFKMFEESSHVLGDADTFWLRLPRVPSRMAAVFSLPVQLKRLEAMTTLEYLQRYFHIRSSRKQLHKKIFMKFRDTESIRVERLPVDRIPSALEDALGSVISEELIKKVKRFTKIGDSGFIEADSFIILASLTERLYCQEMLSHFKSEIEARDLVEQLDFHSLGQTIEPLSMNEDLRELLSIVENFN